MNELDHIDPYNDFLIKSQTVALISVRDAYERCISRGHLQEAKGVETALKIMWQAFMELPAIDTGWGRP